MKVTFHTHFIKKYVKLSSKLKVVCDGKIKIFESTPYDPILNTHKLHGVYDGYLSINIQGDLRAVFKFLREDIVQFVDIDNHANLYK